MSSCNRRLFAPLAPLLLVCWFAPPLPAQVVRYELSGTLIDSGFGDGIFERSFADATPYVATLAYDPSTPSVDPVPDDDPNVNAYRMDVPRGLSLTIGDDVIHLNSYFIEVANDRDFLGEVDDVVSFFMFFDEALGIPIFFNDVAYFRGQISINLVYDDPVTLPSADLPAMLPDSFALNGFSLIGDDSMFPGEVDYMLTTPSSGFELLPTPGDYDGDGMVTVADYDEWRADYLTHNLRSDGNGDGVVDAADYAVWRDALPRPPAPSAGEAAPEPAAGIALLLAGMCCSTVRRRK